MNQIYSPQKWRRLQDFRGTVIVSITVCVLFTLENTCFINYCSVLHVQLGRSPLWSASFNGHLKCVELLIDAGANVDVQKEVSVSNSTHLRDRLVNRVSSSPRPGDL